MKNFWKFIETPFFPTLRLENAIRRRVGLPELSVEELTEEHRRRLSSARSRSSSNNGTINLVGLLILLLAFGSSPLVFLAIIVIFIPVIFSSAK